jgi:hypothetical protein
MRFHAACGFLLMLGIGPGVFARGADSDPFATSANGFDALKPSLETYAASLPPTTRPAGREVRVELVEREASAGAKSLVPPIEPPPNLAFDADHDLPAVRVRLNTAGWVERREWITRDPAGKALSAPVWTGRVLCVRPEETKESGVWSLQVSCCAAEFQGWVEEKGVYQPIMARREIRTQLTLFANRWLALGSGSVSKATDGEPVRGRATMLWLRVADDSTPDAGAADTAPLVVGPTTITPPTR